MLKFSIFVIIVATLQACAHISKSHEEKVRAERIYFDSFTPSTMFDLAREHRRNWSSQKIWGDLYWPDNKSEKLPVMILMHGSGGIGPSLQQWVQAFKEIGVATFIVSTFEPRGVINTLDDQTRLPQSANLADAFMALEALSRNPKIDSARIGIMGFSRGGTATFRTVLEPFRKAFIKTDLHFALHISMYGGCNDHYLSDELSHAPILNLVGEKDDYTTAIACEKLAEKYSKAGASIRTISYADAHHAWDSLLPVQYLPTAITAVPCGPVQWIISDWKITAEKNGETLNPTKLDQFYNHCAKRGVHIGRNEKAYRQSRQDVLEFVKQNFGK